MFYICSAASARAALRSATPISHPVKEAMSDPVALAEGLELGDGFGVAVILLLQ
jgi:hypothetical protein